MTRSVTMKGLALYRLLFKRDAGILIYRILVGQKIRKPPASQNG